jgi:hypothetical protein
MFRCLSLSRYLWMCVCVCVVSGRRSCDLKTLLWWFVFGCVPSAVVAW